LSHDPDGDDRSIALCQGRFDRSRSFAESRTEQRLIDAENCYKDAYETDCRPILRDWRKSHGLAEDPLLAFRASGYTERTSRERGVRKKGLPATLSCQTPFGGARSVHRGIVKRLRYLQDVWDTRVASGLDEPELLRYRSNLLGSDLRITNFGGGNTSSKVKQKDALSSATVEVLWVKGSGGDLGSIQRAGFATLYQEKLLGLEKLYRGMQHETRWSATTLSAPSA